MSRLSALTFIPTLLVGGCRLDVGGLASVEGNGGAALATTTLAGGGQEDGGAVVPPPPPAPPEHLRPNTLHCYRIINSALRTWDEVRTDCQNLGPGWDLATIVDEVERDYVDDTVDPDVGSSFQNDDPFQYWLLGRDITMTDSFEWLNGDVWGYTPWDDNPQDPSNGDQDCIRLRAKVGGSNDVFRDADCTLTSSSLCERPPAGSTP